MFKNQLETTMQPSLSLQSQLTHFIFAGIAALAVVPFPVSAQSFPDRPIRLTVGFPPGTGPDVLARLVSQRVSEQIKQPVVIDNKPGAGAQIATQAVARSAADG
jgi:tripartite-type tricarboxylate transporter receptor subunit TctC